MSPVPQTSITLLKALAQDTANDQWYQFYTAYEEPIRGFVRDRFPSLDPDDVLQETMRALSKCLPTYHYTPDEKGHFRCYLMGIVKHKALDILDKRRREAKTVDTLQNDPTLLAPPPKAEIETWKRAAMEAAVEQLMADTALSANTRTIFEHVALRHEKPEAVAERFGTTRNNVDQIKSRMIERLKGIVQSLTADYRNRYP